MAIPATAEKETTYQVRALERGLSILETVANAGGALSLTEIANQHDLNLSTAFRLVRVLAQLRWLETDEQANLYRLGIRAFEVGARFLGQLPVEEEARPFLESLAQSTGQTASLAVLEDADVVYIGIVHGQAEVGIQSRVGARHPAYCTALGKALISELDDVALEWIIDAGMPRRTANTITTAEVLRHELGEIRRVGYAVDNEERLRGIYCVASPVRNHERRIIAAVSISAPIFAVTPESRFHFARLVTQAARDISTRLGAPADDGEERLGSDQNEIRTLNESWS
jgi:DNA-binding IclR family transcriptional regulator